MKGLVIKNTGSWYQVKTDDGQFIECKIKGNFRLKGIRSTNPVAVGDRVQITVVATGFGPVSKSGSDLGRKPSFGTTGGIDIPPFMKR